MLGMEDVNPQECYLERVTMTKKVLIAYASKVGSTADVADEISRVIEQGSDVVVDVKPVSRVKDVTGYDAVIVGSAIRGGKWLPSAVQFIEQHQDALKRIPVAYFVVCLTMRDDTEENRRKVIAYLDPVRKVFQPLDIGLFAGELEYEKFPLPTRLMVKLSGKPCGDFRNWDAIRAWASSLRPALLSA
jgi:menaquinone-dependent protoporphyrinogen oxidase